MDRLHLRRLTVQDLSVQVEPTLSTDVIEGFWCEINKTLIRDIMEKLHKYKIFLNTVNLQIPEYLMVARLYRRKFFPLASISNKVNLS